MSQSLETRATASAPVRTSDRPPVGRFFMLFGAMLALALGLAMLSEAGAVSEESAVTEARAEASQQGPGR
jgi:hypothetical protein